MLRTFQVPKQTFVPEKIGELFLKIVLKNCFLENLRKQAHLYIVLVFINLNFGFPNNPLLSPNP